MGHFGVKKLRRYGIGIKQGVNGISKFGVKLSPDAVGLSPLVGLAFGPEAEVALAEAGAVGGAVSSALEKATR